MNNRKIFSRLSILLVAVLLFVSCSKDKEYTRVIPSDASFVMSMDVASIIKKSGLMDSGQSTMKNISGILKNEKLAKLVENPSDAGLSLTDKVYCFLTADQTPVVLIKVSDKDKLEDAFKLMQGESLCDDVEKASSYSLTTLHGFGLCAFDNSSLVLMQTANPHSLPVKEAIGKLMDQEVKNSIAENAGFKKMADQKGDIGVFASFAAVPQLTATSMMMGLPEDANLKELMFIAQMSFENGKASAECEYYTENESLKAYFKKQAEMGGKINHTFLKNLPSSSLAYLATNLKGDKLYEMLTNSPEFKDMMRDSHLTPGFNLQKSIASFNGDVSVAVTGISESGIPSILAYAEVTDPSAMGVMYAFKKDFAEMGMSATPVGTDEYIVKSMMFAPIHFGVKGKLLFLTNDEACYKNIGQAVASSLDGSRYESIKTPANGYFMLDAENLVKLPMINQTFVNLGTPGMIAKTVLTNFSYVEAYNKDNQKSVVNIYMKNKNENVLKQLVAQLRLLLGAN